MTATIETIATLPVIPEKGKRYLSVNVGDVPLADVVRAAGELGFTTDLVKIPYQFGTEMHVLLWHGEVSETPADMDERVARLADLINSDAIRHCWNSGKPYQPAEG